MNYSSSSSHNSAYGSPLSSPTTSSPALVRRRGGRPPDRTASTPPPASPGITPQCHSGKATSPRTERASVRGRRSPSHIPRPRNAFMIFRSDFYKKKPIESSTEHDHRLISRIIGHCWRKLPEGLRDMYKAQAKAEAEEHKAKYPDYRFRPVHRETPPQRRAVKRNTPFEKVRCEEIALMIGRGLCGNALENATKALDVELKREFEERAAKKRGSASTSQSASNRAIGPAFRSPLLVPIPLGPEIFQPSIPTATSLSQSTPPPLPSVQAQYRATRSDAPYILDWEDQSSSTMLTPPYAQQMLDATSCFLQQGYITSPFSFHQPPLPQYFTIVDHSPHVLSSSPLPSTSDLASSPQHTEYALPPILSTSYPFARSGTFPDAYGNSAPLPPSPEWSSDPRGSLPSSHPLTASEAASHKISMAAQLHGHFNPSLVMWPTNC